MGSPESHDATVHLGVHEGRTAAAEHRIDEYLSKNKHPRNFAPVFKELSHLRHLEGEHFHADLTSINKHLEERHLLPHMRIVEHGEKDFAVVADESFTNRSGQTVNRETVVSESVGPPKESREEHETYRSMRAHGFDRAHNSGWEASVGPNGGAYGHFRRSGIGFQIPEGEHKALIDEALRLCGQAVNPQNESAIEAIIENESSWDPNAENDWDKNAREGQPTQGLMQTRPDVFAKYALPGYNTNIRDPLSNIVAGIRYSLATYGSLENVPGVVSLAMNHTYEPY
jgi:hypothetical protein